MKLTIIKNTTNLRITEKRTTLRIMPFDTGTGKIPLSVIEAAGDMIYGTGPETVTNLVAGNPGDILKVSAEGIPEWGSSAPGGADILEIQVFGGR
jgi:hypothetical protein